MLHVALLATIGLQFITGSHGQDMETITGTIYCDNEFSFYVNGELIAQDPIPISPHNAVNVTFQVEKGQDITFGIDWANESTGLVYDNRCVSGGGLRAMFSNGVVTNNEWVCSTYQYGPVNWKECYAGQTVRDPSQQLSPVCNNESVPALEGCVSRLTERPEGWSTPEFDDTRWEYALEWDEAIVGWGLRPAGCTDPDTYISSELDPNGNNITCPENLNWGDSEFIWRPDIDLDNYLLCRYTFKASAASKTIVTALWSLVVLATLALTSVEF